MYNITFYLSLYYFIILFLLAWGIFRLRKPLSKDIYQKISVIVAARNEEDHIEMLINRLSGQNYPLNCFEIIIVDDRSEDETSAIVRKIISNTDSGDSNGLLRLLAIPIDEPGGKKRALAKGIAAARFPLLVFTDADCFPKPDWLSEINRHFEEETDYIAGYSPLVADNENLLYRLRNLERLSIFAVTAGSLGWSYGLTCTGRNHAYRRKLYDQVNGFSGLEDIPSGDDDLMLQRMSPHIRKMNFMFTEDSIVPSTVNKSIRGQIDLETRRASKWSLYPLPVKIGTALVFLYYAFFMVSIILTLAGKVSLQSLALLLMIKMISELTILIPFLIKINRISYLKHYPLAFFIHLPYFLFFALKGTFGKYQWK